MGTSGEHPSLLFFGCGEDTRAWVHLMEYLAAGETAHSFPDPIADTIDLSSTLLLCNHLLPYLAIQAIN